ATEEFEVREGADVDAPLVRLSHGATIRGMVRDPGGRPVEGATVEVHDDPDTPVERTIVSFGNDRKTSLTTDAEGRFEAKPLAAGTVTLTANKAGFAASRRTTKVAASGEPPPVEIGLRTSSDLQGTVVEGDGKAVVGAQVWINGSLVGREGDDAFVESANAK